jgi:hypothetical protein
MHQNAMQNAAKRKVKRSKTQGECNNMQCEKGLKYPPRQTEIACKMGQNEALTTAVLVLNAEKSDDKFCAWSTI